MLIFRAIKGIKKAAEVRTGRGRQQILRAGITASIVAHPFNERNSNVIAPISIRLNGARLP